jgi:biopolymer transport protein ExbB
MKEGMDFNTMVLQGWPILSILFLLSIISVTVIVDRLRALRRADMDARRLVEKLIGIIRSGSPEKAMQYCGGWNQPAAVVAASVIAQEGGRESRERALQHAVQAQIRDLEEGVPILGTIASAAPFVGLFGTVIGIIRAFSDIASNVGGGPEVVANGIAEALVTTAGGLLVAIPALIGYNYFIRRIQRLSEEIDLAAYDLIDALCRESEGRR